MDKSLIETATKALTIQGVYLRNSTIHCKDGFLLPYPEVDLDLVPQYRGTPSGKVNILKVSDENSGSQRRIAVCHFEAAVRLVDNARLSDTEEVDEEAVYVEIEADFSAHYDIHDGVEDETLRPALEEFVRYNVGYHVWPYWREYVQGSCARMGIPPIPVPMYLLKNADSGDESDKD
jgi:hypothetical protein